MKVLVVSDTHGLHDLMPELPEADVFIHAGDFMNRGLSYEEIHSFRKWIEINVRTPANRRYIVAGNHDVLFDATHRESSADTAANAVKALTAFGACMYVQEESIEIDGVKFFFSPWTPEFFNWGFNAQRGADIRTHWNKIPNDTNFLVTHGPPTGILDTIIPGAADGHIGCDDLYDKVKEIKPKYHVFGHIHGSRGIVQGKTTFINASFLNERYRPHPGYGYFLVEV